MKRRPRVLPACVVLSCLLVFPATAQHKIDAGQLYERIWVIAPVIGTGKARDEKRPMFTPPFAAAPGQGAAAGRTGILAMQCQFSDDGKTALMELVALNRSAFNEILNSKVPGVKVFERGKTTKNEVETEFKKYKKDFQFNDFTARVK